MDIVKELTRLHELAGETTVLNFRALMQNELRKLIEQAQEEAAQHRLHTDACHECEGRGWVPNGEPDDCDACNGTGKRG